MYKRGVIWCVTIAEMFGDYGCCWPKIVILPNANTNSLCILLYVYHMHISICVDGCMYMKYTFTFICEFIGYSFSFLLLLRINNYREYNEEDFI